MQAIEYRIQILEVRPRCFRLQSRDERLFARYAAVPRIRLCRSRQRDRIEGGRASQDLGPKRRKDRPSLPSDGLNRRRESLARQHGVDPAGRRRLRAGDEARPEHALDLAPTPLVGGRQIDGCPLRPSVDNRQRPRLDNAGQIEELIALSEWLLAGTLRGALEYRDAISNRVQHTGTTCGKLFRREDLRASEDRLGVEGDRKPHRDQRQNRKSKAIHAAVDTPTPPCTPTPPLTI